MQCTTFLSHYIYMYDWLILLRWGSLELLQGKFLNIISGPGLVINNCQENGINEDNYCNGRIRNVNEEPLKMAIVRTWFFVWKKSPAYLFNHEEKKKHNLSCPFWTNKYVHVSNIHVDVSEPY